MGTMHALDGLLLMLLSEDPGVTWGDEART